MPGADQSDIALLLDTVREAGRVAMSFFQKNPKHWHKPDGTTVTEGDLAVDDVLRGTIRAARPRDGWLSEETKPDQSRLTCPRLWIADPIDGTRQFLHGHDNWGVGVALTEEGRPILSALFLPSQKIFYHAVKGAGAFRNGAPLRIPIDIAADVIAPKGMSTALGEAGFRHRSGHDLPLLLRFAAIAEGKLAGAITMGEKNDWDVAAGHLLLAEAGGLSTGTGGEELIYNRPEAWQPGVIAAHSQWHSALLDLMRSQ